MALRDIDRIFNTEQAEDLALQKIDAAHQAARMPEGYNHPVVTAQILHAALYDQPTMRTIDVAHLSAEQIGALYKPYEHSDTVPVKEAFIDTLYDTIIAEGTPHHAFHPGARAAVEELYRDAAAQIVPWTQGHVEQQLSKVAALGIQLQNLPFKKQLRGGKNSWRPMVLSGIVAPDKFDEASLNALRQLTAGRQLLVAEDRPASILRLQQTKGFEDTLGIWVVHGTQAEAARQRMSDTIPKRGSEDDLLWQAVHRQAIQPIAGPRDMVSAVHAWSTSGVIDTKEPYSVLLDFDGTLINTTKRIRLQHQATLAALVRNQWIRITP